MQKITKAGLVAAVKDSAAGKSYDRTDPEAKGLMLRVGPLGVRWSLRVMLLGKQRRWDLGGATDLEPDAVRKIARDARELCKKGLDPTEFIQRASGLAIDPTGVSIEPETKKTTWTFAQAVQEFLVEKGRTRSTATLDDYKWKLEAEKEWDKFRDQPIASMTDSDVQSVLNRIGDRGAYTSAEGIHRVVRALFNWAAEPGQRERSGVVKAAISDVKPPERERVKPGLDGKISAPAVNIRQPLLPTPREMGRLVAAAHMRALPLGISTAIDLVCRTAQRRMTVLTCAFPQIERLRQDVPGIDEARTKFLLWSVPPYFMKSRSEDASNTNTQDHIVPITSGMHEKLLDCRAAAAYSGDWFFPATRSRRNGQELKFGHLHPSTLTHSFAWIPDVSCSPHDVRRAFGTYAKHELGFESKIIQVILDHSEGRAASVLDKHYDRHAFLAEKVQIMAAWNDWLDEQAKEIWATEAIFSDKSALLEAAEKRREVKFDPDRSAIKIIPLGSVDVLDLRADLSAARGEPRPGAPIGTARKRPRVEKMARELTRELAKMAGEESDEDVRETAERAAIDRAALRGRRGRVQ